MPVKIMDASAFLASLSGQTKALHDHRMWYERIVLEINHFVERRVEEVYPGQAVPPMSEKAKKEFQEICNALIMTPSKAEDVIDMEKKQDELLKALAVILAIMHKTKKLSYTATHEDFEKLGKDEAYYAIELHDCTEHGVHVHVTSKQEVENAKPKIH